LKNNKTKILFTYLVAFSKTGGLEKVNRTILKCLSSENDISAVDVWSLYDKNTDINYFPESKFKGFGQSKLKFVIKLILNNRKWNKIIVGHINLAFVIRIIKLLNPKIKIVLIVHGIEVWDTLSDSKLWLLQNADKVISVSNFTKKIIIAKHKLTDSSVVVLNNCLDPYFPKEFIEAKPTLLLDRYKLKNNDNIILTITRINENEGKKGYDLVIKALYNIMEKNPDINFRYLLCGKYTTGEFNRLTTLIEEYHLTERVEFTGFIADEELIDHYRLSDIYIMPSKKEGFGMVYIEAAACGLQVVAGNADGSKEALLKGEIGHLVNPDSVDEIYDKLLFLLQNPIPKSRKVSKLVYEQYNFETYRQNLNEIIKAV